MAMLMDTNTSVWLEKPFKQDIVIILISNFWLIDVFSLRAWKTISVSGSNGPEILSPCPPAYDGDGHYIKHCDGDEHFIKYHSVVYATLTYSAQNVTSWQTKIISLYIAAEAMRWSIFQARF